jgi:predicted DNA-binding transcriptional regulator AlpA
MPVTNTDDDLLTTAEVAVITRAPASTVRYWRHIGSGPPSFRLGRRVVYRRGDVHAWIAGCERDQTVRRPES